MSIGQIFRHQQIFMLKELEFLSEITGGDLKEDRRGEFLCQPLQGTSAVMAASVNRTFIYICRGSGSTTA